MYLIPQPQQMTPQPQQNSSAGSFFLLSYDQKIVIDPSCGSFGYPPARLLQAELRDVLGYGLAVTRGSSKKTAVRLSIDTQLGAQEYCLHVEKDGIQAVGGGKRGLLYAVQTLRQILRQTGGMVPLLSIRDYPAIENRGYYYDVTRGRIPTLDYLKRIAGQLAFYKINQLQLYIEHSFLFEGCSEVWRDDTPLSAQDILELDAYCLELGIELVPSLSCFGHLYKVLRTRSFRHLCELEQEAGEPFRFSDRMAHHTIAVSNPQSLEWIKGRIEAYLPLFTSKHFNIGADETFDLGKGRSRARAETEGTDRLYIDFVKQLCRFLVDKGKIPMFWGDIICHFPQAVKELAPETICLTWGYDADQDDRAVKKLAQAGAVQYTCPGVSGWNQLVHSLDTAFENIRRMCTYARTYGASGVLTTDWGDYGHINHPDFGLPAMVYAAAFSWNDTGYSFDESNRQISRITYGDRTETFVGTVARISDGWRFQWGDLVKYKEGLEPDFAKERLDGLDASLANLEAVKRKLYGLTPCLPKAARPLTHAYLVAIQGIALFGKIERYLFAVTQPPQTAETGCLLASRLEEWFYYYKELWRRDSRESELYRIQEVVFWYADRLRSRFDPADARPQNG
ncbi:MAG: family 20 glycosylhydrolase [Eubacterium sp.]|nr:family 20 glycosylhydrolase [Eubacterium sp.]